MNGAFRQVATYVRSLLFIGGCGMMLIALISVLIKS
jgi:hypothetical protein